MSQGILTTAGRNLFAAKHGAGLPLIIDRFMLANIAGLNPALTPPLTEPVPAVGNQVAVLGVTQSGYVTPDKVVYSLYMGTQVGDFTFNWVGLLADDNTLVAVRYIDPVEKYATDGQDIGNAITRNFLITYTDAQAITNITVDAATWQLNFEKSTETEKGLIEIANQLEVDNGEDDERAVTSLKLASTVINNLTSNLTKRPLSAAQGKVLNDAITAANTAIGLRVLTSAIVNTLTSTATNAPLSAARGKVLNDAITAANTAIGLRVLTSAIVNTLTSTAVDAPLSAAQGKVLKDLLDTKANIDARIWTDVTASRAGATIFQNTKPYAIQLSISGRGIDSGVTPKLQMSANGTVWIDVGEFPRQGEQSRYAQHNNDVPSMWYYRVDPAISNYVWSELQ